jgi:DNA polymerase elongation subunit (family B)
MIIDYFYPADSWEGVGQPSLYIKYRGADGVPIEHIINPSDEDSTYIPPHCWIPQNTHPRKLSRLTSRYAGTNVRDTITAKGIMSSRPGERIPLQRLDLGNPMDIHEIKREIMTFEGDITYEEQVMKHLYPVADDIPDFHPRIWYFDMEWQPEGTVCEGQITMIAIDDTHSEKKIVFAWKQEQEHTYVDFVEREGGYMRYIYGSEKDMLDGFLLHLEKSNPDIFIAHALLWADLPKLVERLDVYRKGDKLSPVNQVIRKGKNGYKENAQPVLGRLCYDTAQEWSTGAGLEALWQKSGRGQFRNRKLATIAEDLELDKEFGDEGAKMDADVFTWWIENFDEFVDYCMRDTTLLRRASERINVIPYHLAMQKHCGVPFKSTCNVSRYLRGLISRATDLKALTTMNSRRDEYQAATVPDTVAGRHEGVACIDFKSMYPTIFVDANLCLTTKRNTGGENIRTVGNGTHWDTQTIGVIPSILKGMLELRAKYKRLLKEAKTDEEKLQYDMMQTAVKVATNAAYGYVSQKAVSGGWIDPDIGATITYYGRQCIRTLLDKSDDAGYTALAGHTDSGYIQIPFDKIEGHLDYLNSHIQERYDLPNMEIELEAYFDYWLTAGVKNQNFGIMVWPPEKQGTLKVTGFSYKASSVSPVTKEIQGKIFQMVGTGADEDEVTSFVRPIALSVLKGERSHEELAPYGKWGQAQYKKTPPMAARAAMYYNKHINDREPFRVGDSIQWLYVKATPDDKPDTQVVGFRNMDEIDGFYIDYDMCVEKFIRKKIMRIYEALEWDVKKASGAAIPKSHF